jgi:hypothetical protein
LVGQKALTQLPPYSATPIINDHRIQTYEKASKGHISGVRSRVSSSIIAHYDARSYVSQNYSTGLWGTFAPANMRPIWGVLAKYWQHFTQKKCRPIFDQMCCIDQISGLFLISWFRAHNYNAEYDSFESYYNRMIIRIVTKISRQGAPNAMCAGAARPLAPHASGGSSSC